MRFFVSSILVALAANRCSGFLLGSVSTPQACVINCNDNTPICGRSTYNNQCKYYSSSCGMQADNCRSQLYYQTNLSQCDGLLRGESGRCLNGNNGDGTDDGSIIGTIPGNGNRRRNRNRRGVRNRRARRNRRVRTG